MNGSLFELKKPNSQTCTHSSSNISALRPSETPKILTNLILKAPPESHADPEMVNTFAKSIGFERFSLVQKPNEMKNPKYPEFNAPLDLCQVVQSKEEQDVRVKGKLSKKGKRDGQNIRTYARYDSVIQALQQELSIYKIIPTPEDRKLLDQFEMKSKRSLERFFFYLLLAKRENKLKILLPRLKLKVRAKILQKGGHRTQQFLLSLKNCIQKYLDAGEKLQTANSLEEAKAAFSIAYLSDLTQCGNERKPHHSKIKGIDKCLQIYSIIMEGKEDIPLDTMIKNKSQENNMEAEVNENKISETAKVQNVQLISKQQSSSLKLQEAVKLMKKKQVKYQDESYSVMESELLINPNQKRKKIGVKNKKQDDRDIQKYAKFDIVSQSSLQFLKIQKLHKNIPQICKKLSQRSLHFFFVILALIQKEKKDAEFLNHLELNYERKVQKRYSQRSEYFRQKLHKSFFNLIQATRKLFQGDLDEALDIAYQVRSQKKTHPAKASQQKKCRQIYQAIRSALQGTGEQSKMKLQFLIQNDKGHRSQLIKQLKCPTTKLVQGEQAAKQVETPQATNQSNLQPIIPTIADSVYKQQEMQQFPYHQFFDKQQRLGRQPTAVIIPIVQRPTPNFNMDIEFRGEQVESDA